MIHLLLAIIYLAFISLGLPDAVLGAAWPSIYPQFGVPVSYTVSYTHLDVYKRQSRRNPGSLPAGGCCCPPP